jgi:hypothetical protein
MEFIMREIWGMILYRCAAIVMQSSNANIVYNLTTNTFILTSKEAAVVVAGVADETFDYAI